MHCGTIKPIFALQRLRAGVATEQLPTRTPQDKPYFDATRPKFNIRLRSEKNLPHHLSGAKVMSTHFSLLLLFISPAYLVGHSADGAPPVRVDLSLDDPDGLVACQKTVHFTAKIANESGGPVEGIARWVVHSVAFDVPTVEPVSVQIAAKETHRSSFALTLPASGFADVECTFVTSSAKRPVTRRRRIGCNPESLQAPLTQQPDFDKFWDESLRSLAAIRPEFKVRKITASHASAMDVYEVTMRSFDSVRVSGWLEVPRSAGPHPAALLLPAYGQSMRPVGKRQDMIVFSFNPRGHGNSQLDVPGKPVDYWIRGLDDKARYYYRGAYLDCIRAVDFLASRSDVHQDRIAVWGCSQGGGLALATAALDGRIDLCIADIPFLCDWVNYFELTHWPEMDAWIAADSNRNWQTTLITLSYFDTLNLAHKIRCPTWMGLGLQDQICPPTTGFTVFNRIRTRKSFVLYPFKGHGLERQHNERVWTQLRHSFGITKQPDTEPTRRGSTR